MALLPSSCGKIWLSGLLASSIALFGYDALGQAPNPPSSTNPGRTPASPSAGGKGRMVGYVPAHMKQASLTRNASVTTAEFDTEIVDSRPYLGDPSSGDFSLAGNPGVGPCCSDGKSGDCELVPCCTLPSGNLEVFAGVEGFTGPRNRGGSASFGFGEGVNWSVAMPGFKCLAGQIGFRATHSNFSGAEYTNDTRNQMFVTGGLFRRVDLGLQAGLVFDYLSDSWYRDTDVTAIRGEVSWVTCPERDFGFWFSTATDDSRDDPPPGQGTRRELWETTDLFAFFYRQQLSACNDGEARIFAGFTGHSDGLIGADIRLPLSHTWALETGFTYLVPKQGNGTIANYGSNNVTQGIASVGHAQEAWNVGINLVWYPSRLWNCGDDRYARPLFRVADNGTMMVDLLNR